MRVRPLSAVMVGVVACSLGCADRREPVTREHLQELIASQSSGALTLVSMAKTNGYDHERDGMKLYTLEWEAQLQVHSDGWKAGWRDFTVLSSPPNALAAAVEGVSTKRLLKGATAVIQGNSSLQKADRGWRVVESTVTASKILPPPDAPGEGRSSDIQTFFAAFRQALASKNTQSVAKFVQFPFDQQFTMVSEADFLARFVLTDDEVRIVTETQSPTRYPDGSYGINDQVAFTFKKNADGYWKWSSIYYGE